ncbi:MAG: hypothetical protein H5T34_01590 [Candidatus Methanomethyliales bacterium]|nr:hypothetical protein [Candidatus Methanomethylicales archaeon]
MGFLLLRPDSIPTAETSFGETVPADQVWEAGYGGLGLRWKAFCSIQVVSLGKKISGKTASNSKTQKTKMINVVMRGIGNLSSVQGEFEVLGILAITQDRIIASSGYLRWKQEEREEPQRSFSDLCDWLLNVDQKIF